MSLNRNARSTVRNSFVLLACLAISSCVCASILPGTPQTIPGLGTTAFPTSTKSPAAQTAFMRGLLLLHLFEYPDAAKSFTAAEKLDPGFAMAYWGDAMTFNHGIWNQVDVTAGQAALARFAPSPAARAARIPDPRERAPRRSQAGVVRVCDPRGEGRRCVDAPGGERLALPVSDRDGRSASP